MAGSQFDEIYLFNGATNEIQRAASPFVAADYLGSLWAQMCGQIRNAQR